VRDQELAQGHRCHRDEGRHHGHRARAPPLRRRRPGLPGVLDGETEEQGPEQGRRDHGLHGIAEHRQDGQPGEKGHQGRVLPEGSHREQTCPDEVERTVGRSRKAAPGDHERRYHAEVQAREKRLARLEEYRAHGVAQRQVGEGTRQDQLGDRPRVHGPEEIGARRHGLPRRPAKHVDGGQPLGGGEAEGERH
jgi:hypothetical protein